MSLHHVEISDGPGGPVIALTGEVDLSAVAAVEEEIAPTLDAGPELLVFDLRGLDFLDSSGLRLILRIDQAQREAGRRLVVVRGGRRVARVFDLTGADRQLETVDDPAEI
jgi:anti-sigma B factor antagonist